MHKPTFLLGILLIIAAVLLWGYNLTIDRPGPGEPGFWEEGKSEAHTHLAGMGILLLGGLLIGISKAMKKTAENGRSLIDGGNHLKATHLTMCFQIITTFKLAGCSIISICLLQSCSLPKDIILDNSSILECTQDEVQKFDFIQSKQQGLNVWNPMHEDIGYPSAFYDGIRNYYWTPVNGKKIVACGIFKQFSIYDGNSGWPFGNDSHDDEYDWNLSIIPSSDFSYIITHVYENNPSTKDWITVKHNGKEYNAFQAEITPDETLFDNPWFPNRELKWNPPLEPAEWLQPDPIALDQNVCVYGPWVMDDHHNHRPEIHPSEAIWWRKRLEGKDEFYVFGIQDDSNRYDEPSGFEFNQDFGLGWRPWAAPPIVTQIQIPFEYDGTFSDYPIITIEELIPGQRIVPLPENNWADSDLGPVHQLKLRDKKLTDKLQSSNVLVEVREEVPLHPLMGVQFSNICRKPNGNIIGYVDVTTAYGEGTDGQEGFHVLKITVEHPRNKVQPPVKNPGID